MIFFTVLTKAAESHWLSFTKATMLQWEYLDHSVTMSPK